jgi:hypothetical protein
MLNIPLLLQDFDAFGIIDIEELTNRVYGKEQVILDVCHTTAGCWPEQLQQGR